MTVERLESYATKKKQPNCFKPPSDCFPTLPPRLQKLSIKHQGYDHPMDVVKFQIHISHRSRPLY